jgi:hypothetical protein
VTSAARLCIVESTILRGSPREDRARWGSAQVFRGAKEDTLLVAPGDREEIVLSALKRTAEEGFPFCGIVLSHDINPTEALVQGISNSPLRASLLHGLTAIPSRAE